jgi:hypothetical protein
MIIVCFGRTSAEDARSVAKGRIENKESSDSGVTEERARSW